MAGMTNEKVSEMVANANDSAENEKPDLQRIPIGKIARLPKEYPQIASIAASRTTSPPTSF